MRHPSTTHAALATHAPDVDESLRRGVDALFPPEEVHDAQRAYPESRIARLDPCDLAGLTEADVVVAVGASGLGPDVSRALRAVHLTLRRGGVLVWLDAGGAASLFADAGFCEARCSMTTWIARRSVR